MNRLMLCAVFAVVMSGCTASRTQVAAIEPVPQFREGRYVDESLGFEVVRPSADWVVLETGDVSDEGLAIPIVLRHARTGAQVVLQVAPDVASPTQFAERITHGLGRQAGFRASDLRPLPLSDEAVGFDFTLEGEAHGTVAVREGPPGSVFMLMATWPPDATDEVAGAVERIFQSLKPVEMRVVLRPRTAPLASR